jgi:hypothetical protein
VVGGTWWCGWFRHSATNRKVVGSIPNSVIAIFHWHNPSGCTVALGLTQTPTEISTRKVMLGVKLVGAWGWKPYHLHVPHHLVIWEPQPPRTLRACPVIALAFRIGWECNQCKGNEKFVESLERRHYMVDLDPGKIPVPLDSSVWPFWPPPI